MPSYRPLNGNGSRPLRKPWHARAKRDGLEWSLGYYATKAEACAEEERFNETSVPRAINQRGKHQRLDGR
jgi:hypothetical protein